MFHKIGYWYDGEKATVAGWGRMWSGGDNSRHLQETKVLIQSSQECRKTRIGFLLEPKTMICGYGKNADACQVHMFNGLSNTKSFVDFPLISYSLF